MQNMDQCIKPAPLIVIFFISMSRWTWRLRPYFDRLSTLVANRKGSDDFGDDRGREPPVLEISRRLSLFIVPAGKLSLDKIFCQAVFIRPFHIVRYRQLTASKAIGDIQMAVLLFRT